MAGRPVSESAQASLLALHGVLHGTLSPQSAESRLLAVQAFAALLRALAAEGSSLEDVQVGHGLSLLLKAADQGAGKTQEAEGEKELCVTALQTVQLLLKCSSSADALGYFLPGTSVGLCRLALQAATQSSTPTAVAALDALVELLRSTVSDAMCEASLPAAEVLFPASLALRPRETVPPSNHQAAAPPGQGLRVIRSSAWLQSTAFKLAPLVLRLCDALEGHSKSSIRAGLARLAAGITGSCASSLPLCAERSLRSLFVLANDTWPAVSAVAVHSLENIASKTVPQGPAARTLSRMVEAALLQLLGAFSEACARHEQEVVASARLLVRAIELAGPSGFITAVLAIPSRRETLCSGLVRAFAASPVKQLSIAASAPNPFEHDGGDGQRLTAQLPRRNSRLSVLTTDESYQAVAAIARLMGRACATARPAYLGAVADIFLANLRGLTEMTASPPASDVAVPCVAILSEVLFGASQAANDVLLPGPHRANNAWLLPVSEHDDVCRARASAAHESLCAVGSISVDELSHAFAHDGDDACLADAHRCSISAACLELVGVVARSLGESFVTMPRMLPAVMTPLLISIASPSQEVAVASTLAFRSIAIHCGYAGSMHSVVHSHSDYIIDSLCRQLRHVEAHPAAPRMFGVLLRQCGAARALLPVLAEPLRSTAAAVSIARRHQNTDHTRTFLGILAEVAHAAHSELAALQTSVMDAALERHVLLVTGAAVVASEAACPLVMDLDPHCSVFALDTVADALLALASAHSMMAPLEAHQDARAQVLPALLPAVHAAWPAFVSAIGGVKPTVARRAMERLPEIASLSGGDFLRQRFASELWPRMRTLLIPPTARSVSGDAAPGAIRRVQLCVLTCLGSLLDSGSRGILVDALTCVATDLAELLSQPQAQPDVKTRSEAVLRALSVCDADLCWLLLLKAGRVRMPAAPPPIDGSLPILCVEPRVEMCFTHAVL